MSFPGRASGKEPACQWENIRGVGLIPGSGISLGLDDPLEEDMWTHSNILAWRFLWIEEPGRLQFRRSQRVEYD